jgi:iron(III) transport system substrate-binding protein
MRPRRLPTPLLAALAAAMLSLGTAACGADDAGTDPGTAADATEPADGLLVYSGRSEDLVQPVLDDFTEATGVEVEVRYAGSAELAAQLLEEGERTEADVFFSQDAGALGALTQEGLFAELPQETLDTVDPRFRADDGTWVGVSGRARVLAYDARAVDAAEVPTSVFELTEPQWRGKVAYAPTNASFQAFVTAMRVLEGEDRTRQWLEDFRANEAQAYENNIAILQAVDAGEIPLGLINHYYWYELAAEEGAEVVNAKIGWLDQGDPGALVNVAGVGILAGTDDAEQAQQLVDYLLGEDAQTYFAETTSEYPLIDGVEPAAELPPLAEVSGPEIDLSELESLQETLALLEEVGLT